MLFRKAFHCPLECIKRKYSSALFITGDKAQANFAVLTPVIEFDEQIKHKGIIEENITVRKLPIKLDNVIKNWEFFKYMEGQKNLLDETRTQVGKVLSDLLKEPEKNKADIEKLKLHMTVIKDDLRMIKHTYYNMQEEAMLKVLSLPNILHPKTPKSEDDIVHNYLELNNTSSASHIDIGEAKGYVKYINPMICYLMSDAALYEIAVLNHLQSYLSTKLNFSQFSNSDFVRSVVVEGCGLDFSKVLTLEDPHDKKSAINRLHLAGAGSLCSFMAYFTKHFVQNSSLPLELFSIGRKYQNVCEKDSNGLFNLNQSTVVNIFIAVEEENDTLNNVINNIISIYESFGHHFRLVLLSASKLDKSESLRLSIQMYSNAEKKYIEVGNVSTYDTYLSKRLLFNNSLNKDKKYPCIISGTLLNIHKMLGCVLENNSVNNKLLICDLLKNYIVTK